MNILFLQDGDRRWARREGKSYSEAYIEMARKIAFLTDYLTTKNVEHLYIPTNSVENLSRPKDQVQGWFEAYLMLPEMIKRKVNIDIKGDMNLLPDEFKESYAALQRKVSGSKLTLTLLLNWSMLDEIPRIVKKIQKTGQEVTKESLVKNADIDQPIDLIVRSGKRHRLSSFFPLSGQYAEIYFMDILFPDITQADIDAALEHTEQQERTYGK